MHHQCKETLEKITEIKATTTDLQQDEHCTRKCRYTKDQQYSCSKNEKANSNIILRLQTLKQRHRGN
jgi:hypothetical protein